MVLTRKIGKLLRGKATPFQVLAASLLGAWLAFVPGFEQAPAWVATLLVSLLVLNANLGIALLLFAPLKLLSLVAMPITFEVGRFLLDGPTRGLFATLVNAPVLAWFGLEHYVVTGGMTLGLLAGLAAGILIQRALATFRRKLASLEQDSERYRELTHKWWVKLLLFLFVGGGKGKKTYDELLARRVGNPLSVAGLVVVVAALAGVWFTRGLLAEPIVTRAARTELERANGATVELGSVELDLADGRITVRDIALADPGDLATDLFRASELEVDFSVTDLLRRRFSIERIVVSEARTGAARDEPGELLRPRREPQPTGPADSSDPGALEELTLEDVLADVERWQSRLAQARGWLERILGEGREAGADIAGVEGDEEDLAQRLRRSVREHGWAKVVAEGLVRDVPTLTIAELVVDGLICDQLDGDVLDLRATNLSTHPRLLAEGPTVELSARSERLALRLGLDAGGNSPQGTQLFLDVSDLPVDRIASSLVIDGQPLLSGGTFGFVIDGEWSRGRVGHLELPMRVQLTGTTLTIPGQRPTKLDRLTLPIDLRGPIDALRVRVDPQELTDALLEAGADQLANELRSEVDAALEEEKKKLEEKAKEKLGDELRGRLKGLLDRDG